jgi:hypothetical protein
LQRTRGFPINTSHLSNEEATHIYLLATAYLYNTEVGSAAPDDALYVKEKWEGVFYIWHQAPLSAQEPSVAPVAVCTYMAEPNIWLVEMSNGEKIGLFDSDGVWDVAQDDDGLPLVYQKAQDDRPRRGQK